VGGGGVKGGFVEMKLGGGGGGGRPRDPMAALRAGSFTFQYS